MKNFARFLGVALLAGACATAFGGGPNSLFEPGVPYMWKMETWPNGQVPVYTDRGPMELLTNAQATAWAVGAVNQWNSVPTSAFRAQVVGQLTVDITAANANLVYPTFNGGGLMLVFDNNGTIYSAF